MSALERQMSELLRLQKKLLRQVPHSYSIHNWFLQCCATLHVAQCCATLHVAGWLWLHAAVLNVDESARSITSAGCKTV